MGINTAFWQGKKVFVTGHTGFKGSWLCLLLHRLGADVHGYALAPATNINLYELCGIDKLVNSTIGDIRDISSLKKVFSKTMPDVVIHMAAQPLVRYSYENPSETFEVNVMGTVNIFECVRAFPVKALVNVTTDKCYHNKEWLWSYRENEELGGHDPYSSSKACSELVTEAYRKSFFYAGANASSVIASARAGNVIGGGDWAKDRLIPDFVRAISNNEKIVLRNPGSIRPWQHVLEPLTGYLMLTEKLYSEGEAFSGAFNFGPDESDMRTVQWIVEELRALWGESVDFSVTAEPQPHEAAYLKLDCSKAKAVLNWHPRWSLKQTLTTIIDFTRAWHNGDDIRKICMGQISEYLTAPQERHS